MLVLASAVTSQAACDAGRELWGYPRYLTRMRTRIEDGVTHVRLGTELALELGPIRGVPQRLPLATFTQRNGALLRTRVDVRSAAKLGAPSHAVLQLLGGDGRSAEVTQALGLQRLRPVLAFQSPSFQASLPAGDVQGPTALRSALGSQTI